LHTALRRPVGDKLSVNGANIMPEVHKVLNKMTDLVGRIHEGLWRGYTEKPITDVVNIGIGGSFLGPELVSEALLSYAHKGVRCHYLANIDGSEFHELSQKIRAETTLFIVSSKSFNTLETLKNAQASRAWYLQGWLGSRTASPLYRRVEQQRGGGGVRYPRREHLPDVGLGRRPLLAVVGHRLAHRAGHRHVQLQGTAVGCLQHGPALPDRSVRANMPVLLGLLGVWYGNFWGAQSHAILPYDHYLRNITKHLQQLDMESNGKSVRQDGTPVSTDTGPVIWGGVGCNGQHAYHQLLHQGTQLIPADFIVPIVSFNPVADHHQWLYANCLSQSQALMLGKTRRRSRGRAARQRHARRRRCKSSRRTR
jgi:glucose-6-phosphate isomerase